LRGYHRRMTVHRRPANLIRCARLGVLLALGLTLSGCAAMGDGVSAAFADPAKYELYDCKQLETERKALAVRSAELEGLMAKAQSGFAGPVVAEVAYRNDYVAIRGQSGFADEAWKRNKCKASPPEAPAKPVAPLAQAKPIAKPVARSRSDSSVY
jgi:hypothetical protein